MKKIIAFLILLLCLKQSYAQYPLKQFLGSDSTLVTVRGGMNARLVLWSFTDTTQANTQRISQYAGALIYTTGTDKVWYRNSTATGWIEFTSSGGTTTNIYNSDGFITGTRVLDLSASPLTFSRSGVKQFAAEDNLTTIGSPNNEKRITVYNDSITILGLSQTTDTTTYKPLAIDGNGYFTIMDRWPGSGGSTPTLQQVLTAGSTLTTPHTINANNNNFLIDSVGENSGMRLFESPNIYSKIGFNSVDPSIIKTNNAADKLQTITINEGVSLISSKISDQSDGSYISIYRDSIVVQPDSGKIKVDSIAQAANMTNKKVMVWDELTGFMGQISKDSVGGTGGGGSTSPAGINTEIQYNNSGSFGATTGFNFDGTSILSIPATGKYRIGTTQTLYLPNQTDFTGTLIVGNAGGSLSHVTGTDGQYNFFGGIDAGRVNSTGTQNVFVGSQAGYYNTSGYQSTAVGMNALLNQTTARYNTAIGYRAMYGTTDGYFNTAVGSSSLPALTSGYFNSAFGVDALHEVITGVENTATGTDALYNVLGSYNTGYGKGAGRNLKSGDGNISIGYKSMAVPYNSSNTLNIGNYIFGAGIDGVDSTLSAGRIGLGILPASITAYLHLPASTTSYASLRLPNGTAPSSPNDGDVWVTTSGIFARINGVSKQLNDQISGSYINNSASLQSSATFNIDGNGIVGGYLTGQGYTLKGSTTDGNLGIVNSTTAIAGVNNTIFGKGAGASMNGSSANNMLFGLSAGTAITSGSNITAIGANSSLAVNTGDKIVTIGSLSGDGITTSTEVVAIGHNAMGSGSSAGGVSYSTAIGSSSSLALTGTITTNIGAYSGYQQTTSDYSTNIGGFAGGGVTTGDWNVNIGAYSTSPSATANGQLNISNILFGINGYQTNSLSSTPTATGSIGIGVNAPTARLHLAASTSTANTGQLKLTNGTPPTTPEIGLINFQDGLLFLDSSNSNRDTVATRDWVNYKFGTSGGSGGISVIGTIDSETKSANGAVISGSNLVMQTVDATYPGLMTSALKSKLDSLYNGDVRDSISYVTRVGAGEYDTLKVLVYDFPDYITADSSIIGLITKVTASSTTTFTNKTFDADGTGNSITNIENADIKSGAAIDATKIADGTVTSTEFQYINTLSSNAQTQINGKEPTITTLSIAKGGTNNGSLSVTDQNLMISDGSKIIGLAKGTNGQHLIVNGSGNLQWVDTATGGGSSPAYYKVSSAVSSPASTAYSDITGLSFTATSGVKYTIDGTLNITVNATSTGAKFGINGPAVTAVSVSYFYPTSASGVSINNHNSYDAAPASTGTAYTNVVVFFKATVETSSTGTVALRFGSEIATAASVVVNEGSFIQVSN